MLIGTGAALLALVLWFSHALDGWENSTWTWRVRALSGPGPHSGEIVLILLDQPSLDWGEKENGLTWPWPREVYAPLIDFCTRGGARSVSFDVLMTEASGYGVWDDRALAEAMARNGRFIGARFLSPVPDGEGDGRLDDPIAEVADNARMLANVSDVPDADGIFRRASMVRTFAGESIPSLGVAAWLVGEDLPAAAWKARLQSLAIDPAGTALLRYRGHDAYTTYGAAAIIQSELRLAEGAVPTILPEALRDKNVFFGFSAPGLMDLRPTPLSNVSPGVVIHATVLDNLLGGDFLRAADGSAVVIGTVLLALLTGFLATVFSSTRVTVALALVAAGVPALAGFAAYPLGWWWPILPGLTAASLAGFGALVRNYAVEGSQKRFIKQAFRHYLSPAVIDRILVDPHALKLGGERRELSILFMDLVAFTSLSEGLEPEALTTLLNEYLSDMTEIILEEGGTLDKYLGDAIMAFWNAPLSQEDHATRACRAAVRCQRRLIERGPDFRARCGRELRARIGLHTGPVVVGNMGSRQRFDYSVLGDAANLASRLEGANKHFGTETMISADTLAQAGPFQCRALGPLRVVGRQEPVEVFELTGLPGEAEPPGYEVFAEALAAWRAGDDDRTADLFARLSDDPVARRMSEIGPGWQVWSDDGKRVWELKSK